jgi:hypothetical protein
MSDLIPVCIAMLVPTSWMVVWGLFFCRDSTE